MQNESVASAATEKETGRVEAFSDGVFAIAITLLILEIKVPHPHDLHEGLGQAMLDLWPSYVAFTTSFLTILVMWINHHTLFTEIHRSNHGFLLLNGLLLFGITVVPFPTALLAEYLEHPEARLAALIYSGTFIVISLLFNIFWRYASANGRLLRADYDRDAVARITRIYRLGPAMYVVPFIVAFFSAIASFTLCLLLAVYFAWRPWRSRRTAISARH